MWKVKGKIGSSSKWKACSQTAQPDAVRFRNYFTAVLESSTWSTESTWGFSSRNHMAQFQAEWLFQDCGRCDSNIHTEESDAGKMTLPVPDLILYHGA